MTEAELSEIVEDAPDGPDDPPLPPAQDLLRRLGRRYPREKAWALFTEVPVRHGRRRTDALVLNLSLGQHHLEGFEIKVSREDWRAELAQPEKAAEGILPYVHRWWLVTPGADLVRDGELPPGWGHLVAAGRGLRVRHKAPRLAQAKPLDAYMCSVLVRQALDRSAQQLEQEVQRQVALRVEPELKKRQKRLIDEHTTAQTARIEKLEGLLKDVQDTLGLRLTDNQWTGLEIDWGPLGRWDLRDLMGGLRGGRTGDARDARMYGQRIQDDLKDRAQGLTSLAQKVGDLLGDPQD